MQTTTLKLFWRMTLYSAALGTLVGAFAGSAFGAIFANVLIFSGVMAQGMSGATPADIPRALGAMVIFGLIGSVVGGMFGVPTGLSVGVLNGLLMVIVTRIFFFPLKDARAYRRVISLVSAIFTAFAAWFCFFSIALFYSNRAAANVPALAAIFVIPALIAGGRAWFLAPQIAQWYVVEVGK